MTNQEDKKDTEHSCQTCNMGGYDPATIECFNCGNGLNWMPKE
jgi:hypothetical protein